MPKAIVFAAFPLSLGTGVLCRISTYTNPPRSVYSIIGAIPPQKSPLRLFFKAVRPREALFGSFQEILPRMACFGVFLRCFGVFLRQIGFLGLFPSDHPVLYCLLGLFYDRFFASFDALSLKSSSLDVFSRIWG